MTIHFVRDDNRIVASRVVVHREGRMYYDELESNSTGAEKARAKALEEYYDKLEEELDD